MPGGRIVLGREARRMQRGRQELLERLWREGEAHDARTAEHDRRMLHITPDTGRFLALLIQLVGARDVLEIGTSDGYSTVWLGDAAEGQGGRVVTVEKSAWKADLARHTLVEAALEKTVTLIDEGIESVLPGLPDESVDFMFLDADRSGYARYVEGLARVLRPGGLWVTDNAVSHASELDALLRFAASLDGWSDALVPVGKGEYMLYKPRLG
jgi:predicted O-methyltransferase YrrM